VICSQLFNHSVLKVAIMADLLVLRRNRRLNLRPAAGGALDDGEINITDGSAIIKRRELH